MISISKNHNIDVRGIRYPGLISWKHRPTGGTTDYAVEMYFDAVDKGEYECFVKRGYTIAYDVHG